MSAVEVFLLPALRAAEKHSVELTLILLASVAAYAVTLHYIPPVALILLRRNLFGMDINKATLEERAAFGGSRHLVIAHSTRPEFEAEWRERMRGSGAPSAAQKNDMQQQQQRGIAAGASETAGAAPAVRSEDELVRLAVPESIGILAGAVYLCTTLLLAAGLAAAGAPAAREVSGVYGPLTTVTVMLLLGFVDDVLDVRWRYKLLLSVIGSVPLVCAYEGSTSVLLPPWPARVLFGSDAAGAGAGGPLSWWWSAAPLVHLPAPAWQGGTLLLGLGGAYLAYLALLCVFCTNSINILAGVNGVEVGQSLVIAGASVFYNLLQLRLDGNAAALAGTPEAVLRGISAEHQVRALLLLGPFIGVSAAVWRYNRYPARVFVGDSYTYFAGTVLAVAGVAGVYSKTLLLFFMPQIVNFIISVPQLFGLVPCPRHRVPHWSPQTGRLRSSRNLTILNAVLEVAGPMTEPRLTSVLLRLQVLSCAVGFLVRYWAASLAYEHVQ